jgi:hypothetical protein
LTKIQRFVIWVCKKFDREQIFNIIDELVLVLADKYHNIKPKDEFKEKHPNYREFNTDPLAPLDYSKFERSKKN